MPNEQGEPLTPWARRARERECYADAVEFELRRSLTDGLALLGRDRVSSIVEAVTARRLDEGTPLPSLEPIGPYRRGEPF